MPLRFLPKHRLAIATALYWFLLLYSVMALFFWYIKLQQQNDQMRNYKLMELVADDPSYTTKVERITLEAERKKNQYFGEGATFLLIILVGAVFVFRAVRRHFRTAIQQQNFMMAITHELKTPIAVAKLNLETLLKHRLDEQKQHKILQMTLQETNRLNSLTNNILLSSQLEAGGYHMVMEPLDLSSVATKVLSDMSQRFPDRLFEQHVEAGIQFTGDPVLVNLMISNLIDNAIKYSPREGLIKLHLATDDSHIKLSVSDQGPGIPDVEKPKIFQRFYRIGNEVVRKTKGTGLGLFLCKKIVTDHNGIITVSDNKPAGAIFTIQFKNKG